MLVPDRTCTLRCNGEVRTDGFVNEHSCTHYGSQLGVRRGPAYIWTSKRLDLYRPLVTITNGIPKGTRQAVHQLRRGQRRAVPMNLGGQRNGKNMRPRNPINPARPSLHEERSCISIPTNTDKTSSPSYSVHVRAGCAHNRLPRGSRIQ